ncbi:hypothetical protein I3842_08G147400 [Carya illinoinensis]|uniref:Uncharacterized protein n=1 Tax=Carya illinoinensis TaxID=32201 RepID=A0A922JCM6_CARIL|nr:hypothetical protein I3842_08G147400 [Carya illinoinensis]
MEDTNLKRAHEDLQNRIDILRKRVEVSPKYLFIFIFAKFLLLLSCDVSMFDEGSFIDAIMLHDGEV